MSIVAVMSVVVIVAIFVTVVVMSIFVSMVIMSVFVTMVIMSVFVTVTVVVVVCMATKHLQNSHVELFIVVLAFELNYIFAFFQVEDLDY